MSISRIIRQNCPPVQPYKSFISWSHQRLMSRPNYSTPKPQKCGHLKALDPDALASVETMHRHLSTCLRSCLYEVLLHTWPAQSAAESGAQLIWVAGLLLDRYICVSFGNYYRRWPKPLYTAGFCCLPKAGLSGEMQSLKEFGNENEDLGHTVSSSMYRWAQ